MSHTFTFRARARKREILYLRKERWNNSRCFGRQLYSKDALQACDPSIFLGSQPQVENTNTTALPGALSSFGEMLPAVELSFLCLLFALGPLSLMKVSSLSPLSSLSFLHFTRTNTSSHQLSLLTSSFNSMLSMSISLWYFKKIDPFFFILVFFLKLFRFRKPRIMNFFSILGLSSPKA